MTSANELANLALLAATLLMQKVEAMPDKWQTKMNLSPS